MKEDIIHPCSSNRHLSLSLSSFISVEGFRMIESGDMKNQFPVSSREILMNIEMIYQQNRILAYAHPPRNQSSRWKKLLEIVTHYESKSSPVRCTGDHQLTDALWSMIDCNCRLTMHMNYSSSRPDRWSQEFSRNQLVVEHGTEHDFEIVLFIDHD